MAISRFPLHLTLLTATLALAACGAPHSTERAPAPAPDATPAPEAALPAQPETTTSLSADAEIVRPDKNILFLTPEEQLMVYPNMEKMAATGVVESGVETYPLPDSELDLSGFTYAHEGVSRTVEDFMEQMNVSGLLVLKDGEVAVERYANGNTPDTRWTSFSVAKSVVSLLFGAAIEDGHIRSVHEPVTRYLPALRGSAYDDVTIEQLLQMSSGVAWNEDYTDPDSDVARLEQIAAGGIDGLLEYMGNLPRAEPPGTRYNYSTGETHLAGAVLREATGRTLADYLSEKIWRPFGMQSDAYWMLLREADVEHGGCCISATLRDYGRIGMFVLDDGVTPDGTRVLPEGWIERSTRPASTYPGYGYFWWLLPDDRFFAVGIFGQYIHIDPGERVVVALHSAWPVATDPERSAHRRAFIDAITTDLAAPREGR